MGSSGADLVAWAVFIAWVGAIYAIEHLAIPAMRERRRAKARERMKCYDPSRVTVSLNGKGLLYDDRIWVMRPASPADSDSD